MPRFVSLYPDAVYDDGDGNTWTYTLPHGASISILVDDENSHAYHYENRDATPKTI